MTGTGSDKRDAFRELMKDASRGDVRVVLLHEQSRLSREHALDALMHLNSFRKVGCRVVTSLRGEVNFKDIGGLVTTLVDAHTAHDESVKIAIRSVGGRRIKVKRGNRCCGCGLFGYDRLLTDESGNEVRCVHFREHFSKPKNWNSEIVVSSDLEAVDALREVYHNVADGKSVHSQVRLFNERGILTVNGLKFTYGTLERILRNPVYCGTLVSGQYSRGKFSRIDAEGIIRIEEAHEALISREIYEKVQTEMNQRKRGHRGRSPGRYVLGTLVHCIHCGAKMYGALSMNGGRKESRYYRCCSIFRPRISCDRKPEINAVPLEQFVLKAAVEHLLTDHHLGILQEDASSLNAPPEEWESNAIQQREGLLLNINRAEQNLALAENPADFRAIASLLSKWRDELEELNQRIEKGTQARSATPQALIQLARLTRHADQHLETDALRLSQALGTVIDRVYVGRRIVEGNGTFYVKDSSYRGVYGEIHFSRAVYDGPPIDFTEVDLGIRRVWRDVANYVAGQARPVLSNEVCRQFGFTQSIACRHLAKGVTAGIIKRVGPRQGWIAASLKA